MGKLPGKDLVNLEEMASISLRRELISLLLEKRPDVVSQIDILALISGGGVAFLQASPFFLSESSVYNTRDCVPRPHKFSKPNKKGSPKNLMIKKINTTNEAVYEVKRL